MSVKLPIIDRRTIDPLTKADWLRHIAVADHHLSFLSSNSTVRVALELLRADVERWPLHVEG